MVKDGCPVKTPPTSRRNPGGTKELVRSLDALDRAHAILRRIEAQCAVLQAAVCSSEVYGINPAIWIEALGIISDNINRLRGVLGHGSRSTRTK